MNRHADSRARPIGILGAIATVGAFAAGVVTMAHGATSALSVAPGSNGQIAWVWLSGFSEIGAVYVGDPDGTNRRELLRGTTSRPIWSPDGRKLVVGSQYSPARPVTMNADGSGITTLDPGLSETTNMACDAWSPDGAALLCEVQSDSDASLDGVYRIRASDGGGLKRLTADPYPPIGNFRGGDVPGDFSPDGTQFVFMRAKPGSPPDYDQDQSGALFVEEIDGSDLHQITPYGLPQSYGLGAVDWSPDGNTILFGGDDWSLYVVHPDGSGLRKLVPANGNFLFSPAWSPDGRRIAYALNPGHTSDIYTARADGTHPVNITKTDSHGEGFPVWGTHPRSCAAQKRALNMFRRTLTARRRAYFRAHRGEDARAAFVKAQRAKLRSLQHEVTACTTL